MSELPPVCYVNFDDESIAYRDFGGAGIPIVYLGTFGSHQDLMWEEPGHAHLLRSLGALGRLVTFDRRGCGLSSRTRKPTIEVRVEDLDRVLDAAAIDQAVLVASSGATSTGLAFGAMRPDRTRAIVMYSAAARSRQAPDYEFGVPDDATRDRLAATASVWGTGVTAHLYAPSLADDPQFVGFQARYERAVATPTEARHWVEMYAETDVRDVLPLVRAPALVVTPTLTDQFAPALSRYVADHLPDARAVEIPARDMYPFGDGMAAFLEATTSFLSEIGDVESAQRSTRRLATVLFTDLVASTEQMQSLGDKQWSTTMDSHDDAARRAAARYGGRVVKSTGDGVLAVFDGPANTVRAAVDILRSARRLGLAARAGVHVGELEERGDDVAGIAVTLCSRIADCATADEVLVSNTLKDLVAGAGLQFESKGLHQLKGIDHPVELLAARPA
jgi:class 3 adenylate cyclase/pimeloyl-ACP methyl ester carboxylesterase